MKKTAQFSPCRDYRYGLWRCWDESGPRVLFIGLNPSTADEECDDPTLLRCIHYAKDWGYGSVCMANLFAYRATDPAVLQAALDPVGPENDQYLLHWVDKVDLVILAWGNGGRYLQRSQTVRQLISVEHKAKLHFLKLNQSGEPAHPLYLKANLLPQRFCTACGG